MPAPQLMFFVEVIQLSCVSVDELVVSLCHRSRPAIDVERAQFVDSDKADSACTVGCWTIGFPFAEMDCVWSIPPIR